MSDERMDSTFSRFLLARKPTTSVMGGIARSDFPFHLGKIPDGRGYISPLRSPLGGIETPSVVTHRRVLQFASTMCERLVMLRTLVLYPEGLHCPERQLHGTGEHPMVS